MWIKKKIRLILGRCPYCNEKLLKGMGGSVLSLNSIKICPNQHYAEEYHPNATLVYDNDGKILNMEELN